MKLTRLLQRRRFGGDNNQALLHHADVVGGDKSVVSSRKTQDWHFVVFPMCKNQHVQTGDQGNVNNMLLLTGKHCSWYEVKNVSYNTARWLSLRPRAKILKKAVQVVELDDSKFFFFILAWLCNNNHLAGLEAILFYHLIPAGALQPENPCGMFNVVLFLILFVVLILHLSFLIPLPFIFDHFCVSYSIVFVESNGRIYWSNKSVWFSNFKKFFQCKNVCAITVDRFLVGGKIIYKVELKICSCCILVLDLKRKGSKYVVQKCMYRFVSVDSDYSR